MTFSFIVQIPWCTRTDISVKYPISMQNSILLHLTLNLSLHQRAATVRANYCWHFFTFLSPFLMEENGSNTYRINRTDRMCASLMYKNKTTYSKEPEIK